MRILITGGTGLIGRALTASLAGEGHEVVVLSRSPERARDLPEGARAAAWDAETPDGWGDLLVDGGGDRGAGETGLDTGIVHLAGESVASGRWTEAKKRAIRESRVQSTRAVREAIEAAAAKGRAPRFLIQASAVGYYGDRGDEVLTESSPPGDDFLAGVAEDWEAASEPVERHGVRRVLLRTGVVLDDRGGALPRMAMPFRLFLGGPLGRGDQWVPWIHRDDEIGAIRFLIRRSEASGPFDLTAPHPVTNRELSRTLARTLGRPCLLPVPRAMLRLVFGDMAEVLLASQRALPQRLEEAGFSFRHAGLGGALEDLLD